MFLFKQKTAYELRMSDWSSDVCSSDLKLSLLRFVASKVDENKSMQKGLLELMRQLYGNAMLRTPLKDSAEIDNATARLMSVYEMDRPSTGKAVRDRCLTYLDGVFNEIELDIRRLWPSHLARLRKEGHA